MEEINRAVQGEMMEWARNSKPQAGRQEKRRKILPAEGSGLGFFAVVNFLVL